MKKPFLIIFILLNFVNSNAKTAVAVVHDTIHVADHSKELELYKMLYQNAKDNSSANYTILYTVVAIVVALLLFILGGQAFFNYRLKKSDLENLKSELLLHFNTELAKLKDESRIAETKLATDIGDKIKNLNEYIDRINNSLDIRVHVLNTSVGELMTVQYKSIGFSGAALITTIGACDSALKTKMNLVLKRGLDNLLDLLLTMTILNEDTKIKIDKLLVDTHNQYPTEFIGLIDSIKNELEKKEIGEIMR